VDRCISCHAGIDNPRMADEALPYSTHSGEYLKQHPVEKFGCTVCHGGQGRALTVGEAFGREKALHWEFPVIPLEYIQSSCGKCHLSVFENTPTAASTAGTQTLQRGKQVFLQKGCLACHKVRNAGGTMSIDLSTQGSKTRHEYSFLYVKNQHTVPNWLREHFIDPQRVAPGSQMMPFLMDKDDMDALITFTMGLFSAEYPIEYYSFNAIKELKAQRRELGGQEVYEFFCAVCHGEKGEGKDYRVYEIGIPSLNNRDFLAVASKEMLEFTIRHGRTGRLMTPWNPELSGLTEKELDNLVRFIRGWRKNAPLFDDVRAVEGDAGIGKILYRSRCGTCHGLNGEGGLGLALNNQDFLSLAPDRFIYRTIVNGRANTAMPSWSRLTPRELAGIMAFIRGWQKKPSIPLRPEPIIRDSGDSKQGEALFTAMCTGCHGKYGQGGVGPAILNPDFLAAASDSFIMESIARGRKDTAMIAWSVEREGLVPLSRQDIKDIVVFMKSRAGWKADALYTNTSMGVPSRGEVLYRQMCSGCHGKSGEGEHGPALNNREFLSAATNGFLQATIALGRSGTAMRSWALGAQGLGELEGKDIDDIVAYIRTWQKDVMKVY